MKILFCLIVILSGFGLLLSKADAADPAAGKVIYARLCATCHGPAGHGDGPAAAGLTPKPRNLAGVKSKGDAYLKTIVTKGGQAVGLSPTMAPMGATLKPDELDALIAYLKTL
ncbi:MAG: cytochrome c [Deltaproteobacteria bacterium]|nr:cytochrome c [Deltaproteobacteria bacterium]